MVVRNPAVRARETQIMRNDGRCIMYINSFDGKTMKVDVEALLSRLHIEPGSEDACRIDELVAKAREVARPKSMYKISFIDEAGDDYIVTDGIRLQSRVLRVNLKSVHRIFPFVATCGVELDEWSKTIDDMLENYWADGIKEMFLYSAMMSLQNTVNEIYEIEKTAFMNPGSLQDWPLTEQKQLFALLGDPHSAIGVSLTDSCLMLPTKSVSGIIFPTELGYANCALCPRGNCPNRAVPYDPHLMEEKYLKAE